MTTSGNITDQNEVIKSMLAVLQRGPKEVLPSRYWDDINEKNLAQLANTGYEDFKTTVASSYFTSVNASPWLITRLLRLLPLHWSISAGISALGDLSHARMKWYDALYYSFLTRMMWMDATRLDSHGVLNQLTEPLAGNPPRVLSSGRLISQDLANSFVEYNSIMEPYGRKANIRTVIELGAGYGRDAYFFLSLHPNIRYIIADIPPALYLSQRYLSSQFPDRRIFKFRDFSNFDEIKAEFESCQIAFLVPNQLQLLPAKSADLFINISSLHEMRPDQIEFYFREIDRITKGLFYTKQWKEGYIPKEDIIIRADDYPVRQHWKNLFHRECRFRSRFFEALYSIDGQTST